ncbi:MAG TPA: NAD-dependent epimerase/dehydratase family protein [Candidatus Cybelea sp.]|nr:NAD-dependent epimerase/dehydratase family protein [Candidatus Cybelea sp.]
MAGRVAVTGATGFVGSHLVRRLCASGWQVRILARRMPTMALNPGTPIELVLGDLDDAEALKLLISGVDAVVHVAGIVKAHRAADFHTVNVEGSRHLAEVIAAAGRSLRVIHVSSLAAREPRLSPYARSKRAGEDAMAPLAGRHALTILRPPAVYGPGDAEILPMFKAAAAGFFPYPAPRGARVSLIHVSDLAGAMQTVLEAPSLPEPLYELEDGHAGGYAWPEIIAALSTALERPIQAFRLPRPAMQVIAAGAEWHRRFGGPLTALCRDKLAEIYHADWAAHGPSLADRTGWRPTYSLVDGFRHTIAWYRAQGRLR